MEKTLCYNPRNDKKLMSRKNVNNMQKTMVILKNDYIEKMTNNLPQLI